MTVTPQIDQNMSCRFNNDLLDGLVTVPSRVYESRHSSRDSINSEGLAHTLRHQVEFKDERMEDYIKKTNATIEKMSHI